MYKIKKFIKVTSVESTFSTAVIIKILRCYFIRTTVILKLTNVVLKMTLVCTLLIIFMLAGLPLPRYLVNTGCTL